MEALVEFASQPVPGIAAARLRRVFPVWPDRLSATAIPVDR